MHGTILRELLLLLYQTGIEKNRSRKVSAHFVKALNNVFFQDSVDIISGEEATTNLSREQNDLTATTARCMLAPLGSSVVPLVDIS